MVQQPSIHYLSATLLLGITGLVSVILILAILTGVLLIGACVVFITFNTSDDGWGKLGCAMVSMYTFVGILILSILAAFAVWAFIKSYKRYKSGDFHGNKILDTLIIGVFIVVLYIFSASLSNEYWLNKADNYKSFRHRYKIYNS